MTGAQMRYFNLNAGFKANFALSIVSNYENGNSKNYSRDEYMDCLSFIKGLDP